MSMKKTLLLLVLPVTLMFLLRRSYKSLCVSPIWQKGSINCIAFNVKKLSRTQLPLMASWGKKKKGKRVTNKFAPFAIGQYEPT